ncbi:GNAT family N-acetyltransferase [Roseateles sp. BYS180W]|uniref:GNAT family N-acetyltransferase n=1 Tax=Roseateles rivi TaxID=3299028 RepID=A0ABW7FXS7_9BURK
MSKLPLAQDRHSYRCVQRLRVRPSDVGAQQSVAPAQFLSYLEAGVSAYWRALALSEGTRKALVSEALQLRRCELNYALPARDDELLEVGLRCLSAQGPSLRMAAAVFRGPDCLAHGELEFQWQGEPARLGEASPQALQALVQAYESGQSMTLVRVGSWAELGAHAQAIRQSVFVDEQGIAPEMEWDAADMGCVHAVAYNRLEQALATGRLLEHVPGVAKIGRMAVLPASRGSGVGRQVLDALLQKARQHGFREALLHAQLSAEGFYVRAGFQRRGPVFEEAGIGHVEMVRPL